jgi:hypothetical protein
VTRLHYFNLGTTYWLTENLSIGARVAIWLQQDTGKEDTGERAAFLTMRLLL